MMFYFILLTGNLSVNDRKATQEKMDSRWTETQKLVQKGTPKRILKDLEVIIGASLSDYESELPP